MDSFPFCRIGIFVAGAGTVIANDGSENPGGIVPWETTFHGQARTMLETYENLDFGLGPVDDDSWVHQRVQAMVSTGPNELFQIATEFTWGRIWGKKQHPSPPDQDKGDLLQAYIQSGISLDSGSAVEIRAGRQELYYGSGRLLASREGANQRLSHDALRASWRTKDGTRIDAFIASPVKVEPDAFDNRSRSSEMRFWGVYSTLPAGRDFVDLYYIGLRDDQSAFLEGHGYEIRHTFGTRYWTGDGPLIGDVESILQMGSAGQRNILAGAMSVGIGWKFQNTAWTPSVMMRADAISGGDQSGSLNTFDPLFQANNYFNEGGFVSPSNLYNLNPRLVLQPSDQFTVNLGVNFQWRFNPDDAVYGPVMEQIGGPAPDGERYLGTAFNVSVEWTPTTSTTVFLGYTHHDAGDSLTSIGGQDVDYLQVSFRQTF